MAASHGRLSYQHHDTRLVFHVLRSIPSGFWGWLHGVIDGNAREDFLKGKSHCGLGDGSHHCHLACHDCR